MTILQYPESEIIDLGNGVKSFKPVMVKTTDIQFDTNNPNKMTEATQEALNKGTKSEQGLDAYPVIMRHEVDQTGKIVQKWAMKVADGEHRVSAMIANGVEEIPVILRDMTEYLRKQIRQTHNGVHGTHDPLLQAQEFQWFEEQGQRKNIEALLGISDMEFDKVLAAQAESDPVDNINVNIPDYVEHKCTFPGCDHGREESDEEAKDEDIS